MKWFKNSLFVFGMVCCIGFAACGTNAQVFGQVFTVDAVSDSSDALPGDRLCADVSGRCTLRAAIDEANFDGHSRDIIIFALAYPAVIDLSLGELPIATNLAVVGPGSRRLTVERSFASGTSDFRVFRVAQTATNAIVRGLTIKNGRGNGSGIMIENGGGLTAAELWFTLNSNGGAGGTIQNNGTLNIQRSLFSVNVATLGGAINNSASTSNATVINCTFTQNYASSGGGVWNTGNLLIINSTFAQNTTASAGEAVSNDIGSGQVAVLNTIFGSDPGAPHSLSGPFVSLGNNIVVDPVQSTGFVNGVNNDQVSEGTTTIDPLLGPLTDNGGQTDTFALLTGSTAIDHGNNCVTTGSCPNNSQIRVRTDQRGTLRGFFSSVDIGAYEVFPGASSGSFSIFIIGPQGQPARYTGSQAILTDASTNAKRYLPTNAFGRFRMPSIPGGTYVLELKTKRSAIGTDPIIIGTNDFPLASLTSLTSGWEVRLERN